MVGCFALYCYFEVVGCWWWVVCVYACFGSSGGSFARLVGCLVLVWWVGCLHFKCFCCFSWKLFVVRCFIW